MRAALIFAFIIVPLIELWIIVQVGQTVGVAWTILALLAVSVLGAWLMRREGMRAWTRFRSALAAGRVPADEVLDGALVLFGGALLLTPGFASDIAGLSLMFPPTRAPVASVIRRRLGSRFAASAFPAGSSAGRRHDRAPRDEIVDVRVINVEREPDRAQRNGEIHSP
jgi:UPF0716 protein FxsA